MDDNDQLTKVTDSVASCYIRTGSLARLLAWLKLLTHLFGATANICENHSTRSTNNCNTTNTHNNEIMRTLLGIFISLLMVGLSASSFMDEVNSLLIPSSSHVSEPLNIGDHAPTSHLSLSSDKASIITFLRHCGCPFAEKQFRTLRDEFASQYSDLEFIAVSHASREDTDDWLKQVGGQGSIKIIIDEPRKIYGEWGLGLSSLSHIFALESLKEVYRVGTEEGIWNRPAKGTRWQLSGSFAVDKSGIVRWTHVAEQASDLPNFSKAVQSVKGIS